MTSSETLSSQPSSYEAFSTQSLVQKNVRGTTDITLVHCKIVGEIYLVYIYYRIFLMEVELIG